ncbi:DNA mismatch repair protein MutS, partial [Flavobacteriaceae bacterium]|nr:DNA mismatch repair protein MutS [Flavobacteriaceae bacterium]
MKQYNAIKVKYPDALLLFRVGDFYETFGSDAVKASRILDIILTKRGAGSESETELAGFPHHSLNTYLPKLVKAGERVAICDQLEDPKQTKTIVKRGVTELVTPGVALNDEVLSSKTNNFLAAVYFEKTVGVAFLDVSTGEFLTAQGSTEYIGKLLQNFNPSEVLIEKQKRTTFNDTFGTNFHTFYLEDWVFQQDYANESLCKHFQSKTLKGFGVDTLSQGIIASGAVMHYLAETQHHKLQHITAIERILEDDYVWMDKFTIRNLELYNSYNANAVTLIDVIDHTISPMGGRLLKRWLALPLKTIDKIKSRHEVVQYFLNHDDTHLKIQNYIKQVGDLERLISKVATAKVNPREVIQLKNSLEAIVPIKSLSTQCENSDLRRIGDKFESCEVLREKIKTTLREEAPVNILKGNSILSSASDELESLRDIAHSGKDYLDKMLARESAATGITSLKIASNNVFGYYIEVRNSQKDKVPENWIRKQTLVNAERYITEELKEYEAKILGAEDRILVIEQTIFTELVSWMHSYIMQVQLNAQLIAQLDCLAAFSFLAKQN